MTSMTFAVSLGGPTAVRDLVSVATSAERAGMDALTVADHLGHISPFQLLALAAGCTSRIRLRTYVLDAYFWNPALLAREVATLDALSEGRVELGLGLGHMRHEHEDAGLPFPPVRDRAGELAGLVDDVRARLADPELLPAAVQQPVPVMVGAWGSAGLAVAARQADVIGLTGMVQVPGARAGTFSIASSADTDAKLDELRGLPRDVDADPVLDVLLQQVVIDEDVAARAAEDADAAGGAVSVEELLDSPFFLYAASDAEAAAELVRRRARWGVTSWSTHAPSSAALFRVAAAVRAGS